MAVFIKQVNIPQKSDLINIDMTGSGTAQTYRIIKKISDDVVEVVAMWQTGRKTAGNTNTYENSILDTYLNTTWYNTLSNTAKLAIVDKTFRQESWYSSNRGNPVYIKKAINVSEFSLGSSSFGNEITRHVYALGVQDLIDYVEATPEMTSSNTTFTVSNILTMLYNDSSYIGDALWLNSASANNQSYFMTVVYTDVVDSTIGSIGTSRAKPAFQIDLSKIDYTFADGRQPVELKPVSILQKSNNALSRVGMSWKIPTYPVKSDIVDIDMIGSGTPQRFRVLKVNGSVAEVISMSNATSIAFDSGYTNTYEGKTLDTYLNTTWYNTLSSIAKLAIVDKTFRQDSWYHDTTGNPDYQAKYSDGTSYQLSLGNTSFGNEITRHVYALSVQDVIDYLEVTPQMSQADTTLTANNLCTMFWNSTTDHNGMIWLSSARASNTSYANIMDGYQSNLNYSSTAYAGVLVRPAFQIDLSKIDFTIE